MVRLRSHAFYNLWRSVVELIDETKYGRSVSPIRSFEALSLLSGAAQGSTLLQWVTREDVLPSA
jgi:hypothetical protein